MAGSKGGNVEVGTAYVSIFPSMKGFNAKLSSGLKSALSSAGKLVKGLAVSAAAKIGIVTTAATKEFSNYQQLTGGIETLFKTQTQDATSLVAQYASAARDTLGMSSNEYMNQVTGLAASLKQSFGGDVVKAAQSANTAISDMADNASVFGTNIEDIKNAYQGFAKQNYTMLDNLKLGYGGTKNEMERLIADANKYEKAQGRAGDLTIDKMGDVVQAIHDVQEQQGIAGNSAKEAATTVSGSLDVLKASWSDWLVAISTGQGVKEASDNLTNAVITFGKNIVQVMAQSLGSMVEAVPELITNLGNSITDEINQPDFSDKLKTGIATAFKLAGSLIDFLKDVAPDLVGALVTAIVQYFQDPAVQQELADGITDLWNSAADGINAVLGFDVVPHVDSQQVTDAFSTIGSAISGVVDVLNTTWNNFTSAFVEVINSPGFQTALQWLNDSIANLGQTCTDNAPGFSSFVETLGTLIGYATGEALNRLIYLLTILVTVINWIIQAIAAVVKAWNDAVDALYKAGEFVQSIPQKVVDAFMGIGKKISDQFGNIKDTIGGKFNDFVSFVKGVPGKILGFFQGIGDKISNLFHFKLPKINVDWKSSGIGDLKIPSFSVSWNAAGGIYDMASLVGVGVGEAGREAVVPLEGRRKMAPFARAVAAEMPEKGGTSYNVYIDGARLNDNDAITQIIMQLFKELLARRAMYGTI